MTVNGRIDDGLYERRTIEAGSVYVKSLNSFFYASAADEEGNFPAFESLTLGSASINGVVTSVSPLTRTMTVNTGNTSVTVDTRSMFYNPLDDRGFQQVDKGDRVSILGRVENKLFDGREFVATSIVTLTANPASSDAQ